MTRHFVCVCFCVHLFLTTTLLSNGQDSELPEYFGLYVKTSDGLREIPLTGQSEFGKAIAAFQSAIRQNAAVPQVNDSLRRVIASCQQSAKRPGFIIYHNTIKPEVFHLSKFGSNGQEEVDLGIAPIQGKEFMFRFGPKQNLTPGVYMLSGTAEIFTTALACFLVDTTVEEVFSKEQAVPARNAANTAAVASPAPSPAVNGQSAGTCSDFSACLDNGQKALASGDLNQALSYLQNASSLNQNAGLPWALMGKAYMALNRAQDAASAWDKAISLKSSLEFNVCHERGIQGCQLGVLRISSDYVSFTTSNGQSVFQSPTSSVVANGSQVHRMQGFMDFSISAQGKKYSFGFIPLGVQCNVMAHVNCAATGAAQQSIVGDYISQEIPKLSVTPNQSNTDTATWQSRINSARSDASKMPPYNGEWQSFISLRMSGSLDGYRQLYLAAINRRSLALDSLDASQRFLTHGDIVNAKAFLERSLRLIIDSDDLAHAANDYYAQGVSNTAAVLNAAYQLSSQSAAALGYTTCGRPCYDAIDVVTLFGNYAVDTAIQGKSAAGQNAINNAIVLLLLRYTHVGDAATTGVTHFVGQPNSVHLIVDQVLNQPEFKAEIMTTLGRMSAYLAGIAVSDAATAILHALQDINHDCEIISVTVPTSVTPQLTAGQGSLPSAPEKVILAELMFVTEQQYAVAPFLTYSAAHYSTLPDGTPSNALDKLTKADRLPSGDVDPSSTTVLAAIKESPMEGLKEFTVFRHGNRIGTFSVSGIKALYLGAEVPKLVGIGQARGFTPQSGDIAVFGPANHSGFWPSPITASLRLKLHNKALALIPKTLPANRSQGAGKPVIFGKTDEQIQVLDLHHDGNTQAFIRLHAPLRVTGGSPLPDVYAELFARYERSTGDWVALLSSVYSGGGETLFGQADYQLLDAVDIDGDGEAEIVLSKGVGEVGTLEVYRLKEGRLLQVCKIEGWTGS